MSDNTTTTKQAPAPQTTTGKAAASPAAHQDTAILIFPPIVHVIFGGVLLLIWILANMMQVQTSEAWFLGTESARNLIPNMTIFTQFGDFFSGHMGTAEQITAFVFAWLIQSVLLVTKIGLARVQMHVAKRYGNAAPTETMIRSARRRVSIWNSLSVIIIVLNSIADFSYVSHLGIWQQIAFVAVLTIATFYFGTFGIQNITAGISKMND